MSEEPSFPVSFSERRESCRITTDARRTFGPGHDSDGSFPVSEASVGNLLASRQIPDSATWMDRNTLPTSTYGIDRRYYKEFGKSLRDLHA